MNKAWLDYVSTKDGNENRKLWPQTTRCVKGGLLCPRSVVFQFLWTWETNTSQRFAKTFADPDGLSLQHHKPTILAATHEPVAVVQRDNWDYDVFLVNIKDEPLHLKFTSHERESGITHVVSHRDVNVCARIASQDALCSIFPTKPKIFMWILQTVYYDQKGGFMSL